MGPACSLLPHTEVLVSDAMLVFSNLWNSPGIDGPSEAAFEQAEVSHSQQPTADSRDNIVNANWDGVRHLDIGVNWNVVSQMTRFHTDIANDVIILREILDMGRVDNS